MSRREQRPVRRVGVDEKSFRRGHGYASIMTDLDESRVLEVVENRDGEAVIAHDRFHVSKYLNETMDSIRKSESKELSSQGKDYLKGTKHLFLRSSQSWNEDHREMF